MSHIIRKIIKIGLPFVLCGGILYWMYRGFDFAGMFRFMRREMDWTWMWLSLPFGILAQMFRAWRWRQMLSPIGEHPRCSTTHYAIFISYAVSLLVPRVGEFTRCGVLNRWGGTSFSKALGTVVMERAVDTLTILLLTVAVLLMQVDVFMTFFTRTGVSLADILHRFTTTGYIVTALCGVAAVVSLYFVRKKLSIYDKAKATLHGIVEGVLSLRHVRSVPLFIVFSLAIWACYFVHYYLTFFCFDFTSSLGISCAVVSFIVGTIAVIVPTPNGAGPWHFAVKTMLILYGVAENDALYFVLIVHTVQTLLVVLLGIYGWTAVSLQQKTALKPQTNERNVTIKDK
ncbi:MAG: lysylphosphatidylglycerol synthase transmembrane domain-containing protein [Prevotella sp.]